MATPWYQRLFGRRNVALASTTNGPSMREIGGGREILPALPRAPDTREFTDLIVGTQDGWSVQDVRGALYAHDQGTFYQSALLCDYMLRDDKIASALNVRLLGLQGLPRKIEPIDPKNELAVEAAEALEEDWPYIMPARILGDLLTNEVLMGFSLSEVIWDTRDGRWLPNIKSLHPQFIYYRLDLRQYVVSTTEGPVYIEPGDGRFLLLSRHSHYRAWIKGAVRPLSVPWLSRQFAVRDWNRLNETYGAPVKGARVPMGASTTDKNLFYSQLRQLGALGTLLLPESSTGEKFELELIEAANSDNYKSFLDLYDAMGMAIQLVLQGQNLSGGEVTSGSLAAAKESGSVRDDFKLADAELFGHEFTTQLVRAYTKFNFGNDNLLRVSWDSAPPDDLAKKAATMKDVATAVSTFAMSGIDVDVKALAEKFELPISGTAQAPAPAPKAMALSRGMESPLRHSIEANVYLDRQIDAALAKGHVTYDRAIRSAIRDAVMGASSYDNLKVRLLSALKGIHPKEYEEALQTLLRLGLSTGAFATTKEAS